MTTPKVLCNQFSILEHATAWNLGDIRCYRDYFSRLFAGRRGLSIEGRARVDKYIAKNQYIRTKNVRASMNWTCFARRRVKPCRR